MESPRAAEGAAALASEAATPGASVAALHGDRHTSAFDTPGPPSPGHASPARHHSQEGGRSASRGRASAGLEAAAAALGGSDGGSTAAAAAAPAPAPPEPLSRPRLRVQGADIILEDASSPKAPAAAAANGAPPPPAAPAGAGRAAVSEPTATLQSLAAAGHAQHHAAQQQQQQQQQLGSRAAHSHDRELQLRLASRTGTGLSNVAVISSKVPNLGGPLPGGDDRARGRDGGGEAGAAGGGAPAAEAPVRLKYRSTLTEENVGYLNKLDTYSPRPDSSERIWRWLESSGPPFDNPPPSLGVPAAAKASGTATAAKRQASKRGGLLSCFNCFGGGGAQR